MNFYFLQKIAVFFKLISYGAAEKAEIIY